LDNLSAILKYKRSIIFSFILQKYEQWPQLEDWSDVIHLPSSAFKQLRPALQKDDKRPFSRVVFFLFKNLHQLLADADQQLTGIDTLDDESLVLNSRVISVSVDGASTSNGDAKLTDSVTMTFSHLQKTTGSISDIVCAFWDPEKDSWANEGCRVVATNSSHTDCECNHLTSFALLASAGSLVGSEVMRSIGSGILFDSDNTFDSNPDETNSKTGTASGNVLSLEIATYLVSTVCILILILIVIQVLDHLSFC
jgi:hypothetical protein